MSVNKCIYVSYMSNDRDLRGVLVLAYNLKKVNSIKTAIILTTDKVYLNLEKKKKFKENSRLGGYDIYSSSKAACEILIDSYVKSFYFR